MEEDSNLAELKVSLNRLRDERSVVMNELLEDRKEIEIMTNELAKMKKQKAYLEGLVKDKTDAIREYDRIIIESEKTLQRLSDGTKKLLLSVGNETNKLISK